MSAVRSIDEPAVAAPARIAHYINGRRVETGALRSGDEVRMGPARLVYRVDEIG